jgi:hypothetical protein
LGVLENFIHNIQGCVDDVAFDDIMLLGWLKNHEPYLIFVKVQLAVLVFKAIHYLGNLLRICDQDVGRRSGHRSLEMEMQVGMLSGFATNDL